MEGYPWLEPEDVRACLIRMVNTSARIQGAAILEVLRRYGAELQAGAVIAAEPGRVRVRPPDDEAEP